MPVCSDILTGVDGARELGYKVSALPYRSVTILFIAVATIKDAP
jgi:hypothetical protein